MTAIQDCRGQPAMRLLTNFIFAFDHDHEQHQRAEAVRMTFRDSA